MKPTGYGLHARVELRTIRAATAQALGIEARALRTGDAEAHVNAEIRDTWIQQDMGEWRAVFRIVSSQNGIPVIAELRIFPKESDKAGVNVEEWSGCYVGNRAVVPSVGITSKLLLKDVKIREAISETVSIMRQKFDADLTGGPLAGFWPRRPAARAKRGGRAPLTDEFLARLAYTYVRALIGSYPVRVTAKTHGIEAEQASYWICVARKRKLLTRTENTQPGGQLTEKARRVLGIDRRGNPLPGAAVATSTTAVQTKGGKRR